MSGDGGRDINPGTQRYPGRQCHPQVSFAAASEGGIKEGGLVKTVCRSMRAQFRCNCLTINSDNYRENTRP